MIYFGAKHHARHKRWQEANLNIVVSHSLLSQLGLTEARTPTYGFSTRF